MNEKDKAALKLLSGKKYSHHTADKMLSKANSSDAKSKALSVKMGKKANITTRLFLRKYE